MPQTRIQLVLDCRYEDRRICSSQVFCHLISILLFFKGMVNAFDQVWVF